MKNNETVKISLPRHLACWLLFHCDKNIAQCSEFLSRCSNDCLREWCLAEMKCFNVLFGKLKACVSKDDMLDFFAER